jgi:predicted nuclease with RNAse H fold
VQEPDEGADQNTDASDYMISTAPPLLGIDVGFSKHRRTTGIAWHVDGKVETSKTYSDWERRRQQLPAEESFAVIAIDGPLLPAGVELHQRHCERVFIRGAFQKRCKPGLSHFGAGLNLRRAARETAEQFRHLAVPAALPNDGPQVFSGVPIIEAFPNAFIGVLLSDEAFTFAKAPKRKKFDWLYECAVSERVFERLLTHIGWENYATVDLLRAERDHEKRAAVVCLLTAMCSAAGKATVIGDETGGYFWLPPDTLWADWALKAVQRHGSVNKLLQAGSCS